MKTQNTNQIFLLAGILGIFTFTFSSCYVDDFDCIKGKGLVFTEVRSTPEFSSIDLRVAGNVIITQDEVLSVEVRTFNNLLPEIYTYVNGSTLIIENEHCIRAKREDITIYISAPDFAKLRVNGSGSIESTNVLFVPDIDLTVSGSGYIDVALNTDMANSRISGSGKIWIEGEAWEHNVEISGSGSVKSFAFYTERCNAGISGSGSCEVQVHERLVASISGSGSVKYKGYPAITSTISGSGKVINAN
jgi:hypothetical protein